MRVHVVLSVLALALPPVGLPSLAWAGQAPKEEPQATIGGCVWAAKPDLLKTYHQKVLIAADRSRTIKSRADFLTAHQPELLAQAAICEKRGDVSPGVSMLSIAAEVAMQDDQVWIYASDPFTRKELARAWTDASEEARQCIRAQVNQALGLGGAACANAKSFDSLMAALGQIGRAKSRSFNDQFIDREKQDALEYYQAYARAELAGASLARMASPAN